MAEPLRLYGLKALVTSAGDGVGEAVARTLVKHGAEVLAVGTNDEISAYIGDATEVVELDGRFVMPGFIEGHGSKCRDR